MKKTMLLVLVAMMAFGGMAFAGESKAAASADKKMYVAAGLDVIAPLSVDGTEDTDSAHTGGGLNLMFNYNVWTYIGVGADVDILGFGGGKGGKTTTHIAISPTVKGFYNFGPQGLPDLEIYARMGFGYSAMILRGNNTNAFALKFMAGVTYDILNSGFFALGELGVTHRTCKPANATVRLDGFTFGLGAGYRF